MYISCRNDQFYLRVRIPSDVKKHFPCTEIKRSLHTNKYTHAKRLAAGFRGKLEEVYTLIRSKVLTDEMIQRVVRQHLDTDIMLFDKGRNGETTTPTNAEWHEVFSTFTTATDEGEKLWYKTIDALQAVRKKTLGKGKASADFLTTETADHYCQLLGLDESVRDTPEYKRLCKELLQAEIRAEEIKLQHMSGNFETDYDKELRSRPKSDRLSDVLQTVRRSPIMDDTINKLQDCLQAETGQTDILLSDLTYRLIDNITNRLSRYPLKRFVNYPGIPLDEVPSQPHVKYVSPATAKGDIKRFKAILAAAENFTGYGKWNLKELTKKEALKDSDAGKKREHFYHEDLELILQELKQRKEKGEFKKNPHLLLIPFIALFQGMRQNEICQLRVSDIIQVDGLWCISVNEEADTDGPSGKRVKSKNSIRVMPVHPELEKLGLIRFYESQRNKRRVRLWEGEEKVSCAFGTDGKHNKLYGQWFLREIRNKIKLQYSRRDKQCFHSFRHTFCGWFKENLETYDRAAVVVLTGHLDEKDKAFLLTETELYKTYDSSLPVRRLYDTLIRLDYGLDLSGLAI